MKYEIPKLDEVSEYKSFVFECTYYDNKGISRAKEHIVSEVWSTNNQIEEQ